MGLLKYLVGDIDAGVQAVGLELPLVLAQRATEIFHPSNSAAQSPGDQRKVE